MTENARRPKPTRDERSARSRRDPFSLEAYLARELERFADGPTMAELLERADRRRAKDMGVSRDSIVRTLHAAREERGDQLWQIWQK